VECRPSTYLAKGYYTEWYAVLQGLVKDKPNQVSVRVVDDSVLKADVKGWHPPERDFESEGRAKYTYEWLVDVQKYKLEGNDTGESLIQQHIAADRLAWQAGCHNISRNFQVCVDFVRDAQSRQTGTSAPTKHPSTVIKKTSPNTQLEIIDLNSEAEKAKVAEIARQKRVVDRASDEAYMEKWGGFQANWPTTEAGKKAAARKEARRLAALEAESKWLSPPPLTSSSPKRDRTLDADGDELHPSSAAKKAKTTQGAKLETKYKSETATHKTAPKTTMECH
jgi:hypothetical protein